MRSRMDPHYLIHNLYFMYMIWSTKNKPFRDCSLWYRGCYAIGWAIEGCPGKGILDNPHILCIVYIHRVIICVDQTCPETNKRNSGRDPQYSCSNFGSHPPRNTKSSVNMFCVNAFISRRYAQFLKPHIVYKYLSVGPRVTRFWA